MAYTIYSLSAPDGEVRYIGYTSKTMKQRLQAHIHAAINVRGRKCHRICWILSLLNNDQKPIIRLLETANSFEEALSKEIIWIKMYSEKGVRLVNATKGGDGVKDLKWTPEQYELRSKKVCQYDKSGKLIAIYNSLSDASRALDNGNSKHNGKISGLCNGKTRRRTFMGFIFRYYGDDFNKYPTTPQWNVTASQRKAISTRQTLNNCMKGKIGKLHPRASAVIQYTPEMEYVQEFDSITEATLKTHVSCISLSCRKGVIRGGFYWKYK